MDRKGSGNKFISEVIDLLCLSCEQYSEWNEIYPRIGE